MRSSGVDGDDQIEFLHCRGRIGETEQLRSKIVNEVLYPGQFLTVALSFVIIAWVLFVAIKGINKLKKEEPAAPPPGPTPEIKLLTEIRDLLKK